MGDVNLKLDAETESLVRGVLRADDSVKNLLKNTTKLGPAARRAGKQAEAGLKGFMKTAAKIAGGLGLFAGVRQIGTSVINQLKREIDHLKQQQARAAFTQMNVGQLENFAMLNRPGDIKPGQIRNLVANLSGKHQVPQSQIIGAVGGALSAKGALSFGAMGGAVSRAVQMNALSGVPIDVTAGGIMDVQRLERKATSDQSLGFLMGIGQQSRVTEYEKYIGSIAPVMSAAKVRGFSAREAGAMWAYTSMMSGDTEGRKSMSGSINFMKSLQEKDLIPYQAVTSSGKFTTKFRRLKSAGGMAAVREYQDAWANMTPAQRIESAKQLGGEAKTAAAYQRLLARDPEAVASFRQAMGGIVDPTDPRAAGPLKDYLRIAQGGRYESLRKATRIFDTGTENLQLANKYGMGDVVRKGINKTLADIPSLSDLGNRFRSAYMTATTLGGDDINALSAGMGILQGASRSVAPTMTVTPATPFATDPIEARNPNADPQAQQLINGIMERLDQLITELQQNRTKPQKVELSGTPSASAQGEAN